MIIANQYNLNFTLVSIVLVTLICGNYKWIMYVLVIAYFLYASFSQSQNKCLNELKAGIANTYKFKYLFYNEYSINTEFAFNQILKTTLNKNIHIIVFTNSFVCRFLCLLSIWRFEKSSRVLSLKMALLRLWYLNKCQKNIIRCE